MTDPIDLGTFLGTNALSRAEEINQRIEAERVRLIGGINDAITLMGCLAMILVTYVLVGLPEQQRIDRERQEI
ncbi:MAG: hypothetical protein QMD99_20415 [Rhizobiaceae bacterium]|nr:hypothetical protein [Rhizobiaceae bacterium]